MLSAIEPGPLPFGLADSAQVVPVLIDQIAVALVVDVAVAVVADVVAVAGPVPEEQSSNPWSQCCPSG